MRCPSSKSSSVSLLSKIHGALSFVAQGSSLPESVTTYAVPDCYVTRSGRHSIPVRKYREGV